MSLSGWRVLVTGATGFIGGHLIERLVLEEGAEVKALVRHPDRASRLAPMPVQIVQGDIREAETVRQACAQCDVVYHCVHSSTGDFGTDRSVNVGGTENVLRASLASKVGRVVHLSTVAVMGPAFPDGANEMWPCTPVGDSYADTKLEGEQLALRYASESESPVVVVRPPIVYGPRGGAWTVGPIKDIRRGRQVLIENGRGICNTLFVGNLVDALLLCAQVKGVKGEVLLMTDDQAVTWQDFLGTYADWLGVRLPSVSAQAASAIATRMARVERVSRSLLRRVLPVREPRTRERLVSLARLLLFGRKMRITHRYVDMVTKQGRLDITKAKRLLGYAPRVSFEEGMEQTRLWVMKQASLLS